MQQRRGLAPSGLSIDNARESMTTMPIACWMPTDLRSAGTLRDADDVHLWLMSLDDPPWPLEHLASLLDADEAARAARFHFERDARRWRAARGLLRQVLAHYVGAAPDALRFSIGPQGKPALAGLASPPSFNLSHSGGHALLGVTAASRLGVDLEVMRPLPDRDAIARSHFAPAEQLALADLPESLRDDGFFACWTRKEAYIKARGGGLSIPLSDFEVALDPREPALLRRGTDGAAQAQRWAMWSCKALPGAWAAAIVERRAPQWHLLDLGGTNAAREARPETTGSRAKAG